MAGFAEYYIEGTVMVNESVGTPTDIADRIAQLLPNSEFIVSHIDVLPIAQVEAELEAEDEDDDEDEDEGEKQPALL